MVYDNGKAKRETCRYALDGKTLSKSVRIIKQNDWSKVKIHPLPFPKIAFYSNIMPSLKWLLVGGVFPLRHII